VKLDEAERVRAVRVSECDRFQEQKAAAGVTGVAERREQ
jgi:hypothetical protein